MGLDESSSTEQFLPLFLSNEAEVRAFIRALVRDPQLVDDVFQAVALVLWRKFGSYDHERPFGRWARGIAAKEILVVRRGMARCPTPFSPDLIIEILEKFDGFVESRGMASERLEALEHCVEALPSASREMLMLRYGNSASIPQVASALRRTVAATQRALSRIRKRLADCIENRLAIVSDAE